MKIYPTMGDIKALCKQWGIEGTPHISYIVKARRVLAFKNAEKAIKNLDSSDEVKAILEFLRTELERATRKD